ncbi:MAG: hypothetical protein S4CHLAM81_10480 [Chlamydiales bacterium]|nr:hypothetical protein [Chlamydiales bacterium]MCH9635826.1 hypothetical protein [Chlamydiales bacterium]
MSEKLSQLYKSGDWALDEKTAAIYLEVRFPATQAVLQRVMQEAPAGNSLLDFGAGPGCDLEYEKITRVEHNPHIFKIGKKRHPKDHWLTALPKERHDIVLCSYSLGESPHMIEQLWELTNVALIIVEPGTPAGYQNILDFRERVIKRGGFVVAPCPHEKRCPMQSGWCHFGTKVARTQKHRILKGGTLGWEEEKYSFVILSKEEPKERKFRILHVPQKRKGHIKLTLCEEEGIFERTVTKSNEGYKQLKKARWGDGYRVQ